MGLLYLELRDSQCQPFSVQTEKIPGKPGQVGVPIPRLGCHLHEGRGHSGLVHYHSPSAQQSQALRKSYFCGVTK